MLAGFLILLSNSIIRDLDSTIESPSREEFADKAKDTLFENEKKDVNLKISNLENSQSNIYKMIETAKMNKSAEQQSFDNWITTRSTLGKAEQDPEVLKRLRQLDEYQQVVQSWQTQSDSISNLISPLYSRIEEISVLETKEYNRVAEQYYKATDRYDLHVFLIRLLFTAPILALGIFFFIRYRNHKLSPLFMGFTLFSIYVFFFGLVPYLPSYGGYIRSIVGVLLTIGLGYYAIKRLREYQERKSEELKSSTEERASRLHSETAERAFNNHVCPSCGKDFLLKNWEAIPSENIQTMKPLMASHYCRYCGMQLTKKCKNCQQDNYAHLPFCINCGDKS